MSTDPRFEIVRTETEEVDAEGAWISGWFVRYISANGRIVWVTPGLHNRKRGSERAIEAITGEPLRHALLTGRTKAFTGNGLIEVRYVDERPEAS